MAGNAGGWRVVLDGVVLSGDRAVSGVGILTQPPDGLGMSELRTEDVTYPQRDGVRHFSDWYNPRIITLADVHVINDGCPGCPTGRQKVRQIMTAWARRCEDTELVLFTDCHSDAVSGVDRSLIGPFGVVGRPRVADLSWLPSNIGGAMMLLRFDAVDHRMYVLDADGTPGSGAVCVTLSPSSTVLCRTYDRCYSPSGMCYDTDISPSGGGPETLTVTGTLCIAPTITLTGSLTNPTITNDATGDTLGYMGAIDIGTTVEIDTTNGTATEQPSGISRTSLLTGNTRMQLVVGDNVLNLTTTNGSDNGSAEVCWRPQVDMA